jgi:hypothetical protein
MGRLYSRTLRCTAPCTWAGARSRITRAYGRFAVHFGSRWCDSSPRRPRRRPDTLSPIVPTERRIPRLVKVRYDTLYKHLRAHLPELGDLGEHFPTAERFAEFGFRHLDFLWLGGARMLLLHGPGTNGVHLFWLDRSGFAKGAFYPADSESTYEISVEGESLRVTVNSRGAPAEHVMLWWGP